MDAASFIDEVLIKTSDLHDYIDDLTPIRELKREVAKNSHINKNIFLEQFNFSFPKDKDYYHKGYLHYLITASNLNLGVHIAPCYIWEIILSQLCILSSQYQQFEPIKSKRMVFPFDDNNFKIEEFTEQFMKAFPIDMAGFIPKIKYPNNYIPTLYSIFGDKPNEFIGIIKDKTNSPYSYEFLGRDEDWNELINVLTKLRNKMGYIPSISNYINNCIDFITKLLNNHMYKNYWDNFMIIVSRKDSYKVYGEITRILIAVTDMIYRYEFINPTLPEEYQKCIFICGCMFSTKKSNILIPEYHCNVLYRNDRYSKLSLEERDDKLTMIKFLKLMKFYDGTYDFKHFKITLSNLEEYEYTVPVSEAVFEKQLDKMNDVKEYRALLKYEYNKYLNKVKKHNDLISKTNGMRFAMIHIKNRDRVHKLKKKYSYWLKGKDEILFSKQFKLKYERWEELTKTGTLYQGHVKFTSYIMRIIFNYTKLNKSLHIVHTLTKLYDSDVVINFISLYERDHFRFNYDWNRGNILFDKKIDNPLMLIIYVILCFHISNKIDKKIKYTLIEKIMKKFSSYHDKIIEESIKCLEKRTDEYALNNNNKILESLSRDINMCSMFAYFADKTIDFKTIIHNRLLLNYSSFELPNTFFDKSLYKFYPLVQKNIDEQLFGDMSSFF